MGTMEQKVKQGPESRQVLKSYANDTDVWMECWSDWNILTTRFKSYCMQMKNTNNDGDYQTF